MANRGMWKFLASKRAAWGEAIVFTSVGGLAAYLKPQMGVPLLVIALICGLYLIWRAYRQQPQKLAEGIKSLEGVKFSRREQAHKELAKLIESGQELWNKKELKQEGDAPFENEEIQRILADIQRERNLPENARIGDSMLEEKLDALVSLYMKFTEFGFPHDSELLENLNSMHTAIRQYINQHIKE
jgi:hypothetical protein